MAGRLFPANGGASIPLAKPVMMIGRANGCDIRFSDSIVSNLHCVLTFNGTVWVVEDKGSRNGTLVNSLPVKVDKPCILKSGDTLTISSKFRLVIEYNTAAERKRFSESSEEHEESLRDDRNYGEHGPATKRLEPHDKDVWSRFD